MNLILCWNLLNELDTVPQFEMFYDGQTSHYHHFKICPQKNFELDTFAVCGAIEGFDCSMLNCVCCLAACTELKALLMVTKHRTQSLTKDY